MAIDPAWLETLARLTTGSARFLPDDAAPYNPRHCLAIYHAPPAAGPTLELPTLLVGDVLGARSGLGCTLLSPLPERPPAGSILLGVWDDIRRATPLALKGVPKPPAQGYHLHIGAYVLLTARQRRDVVAGLQTLAQILAQYDGKFLPAGRIEDVPAFPIRSLYYNPGRQAPRLQPLTRLLGVPFAFKGSRLHLRLNDLRPVGSSAGPGRMEESEASEFAGVCEEYGIELVPHVGWLPRWGLDPGERIVDDCRRLADTFRADRIGLFGPWSESGVARFRAHLEHSARFDNSPYGYVLPAAAALELVQTGGGREPWPKRAAALGKDRVFALEFWSEGESVRRLGQLRRAGVPTGVLVDSDTRGFAPGSSAKAEGRLSKAVREAREGGSDEFGYAVAEWDWGRLWEMELLPATAGLVYGWHGTRNALDGLRQAARLVYGVWGDRILAWLERLSGMFGRLLARPEEQWLLAGAFGFWPAEADAEAAGRSLGEAEEESRQLQEGLRQLRRKLSRNAQTLELFDYGLSALSSLAAQARWRAGATRQYGLARRGDEAAVRASRLAVEALLEAFRPFALRTERMMRERGVLAVEAEAISWRIGRLERVHEELRKLEQREGTPEVEVEELLEGSDPEEGGGWNGESGEAEAERPVETLTGDREKR